MTTPATISSSPTAAGSARAEWRANWPLVLSAMLGVTLISVPVYSLGLFMDPLVREFGWTHGEISSGVTVLALVAIPAGPIVGSLIDRIGPRRLALPGVALTGLALAGYGLLGGSIVHWWIMWVLLALALAPVNYPVWFAAITSRFQASRGLAVAVTMCGSTIATVGVPVLVHFVITNHGWRAAYFTLGLGWCAAVLLLAMPFFYSAGDAARGTGAAPAPEVLAGLTREEALRSPAILRITLAMALTGCLFAMLIVHLVPILTSAGYGRAMAASVMSGIGLVALPGKLATGWLLDHAPIRWVGAITYGLPAVACAAFMWFVGSGAAIVVATATLGWGMGASMQSGAYLISRYGGLRNYGLIFGAIMSVMAVTGAVGPTLAGVLYDRLGTYDAVFLYGIVACLVAALAMATIPPYPDWSARAEPA
ncbi:MFS transporter [Novosphingobium bradum]|uniref:MFS transporter n=1 Tax=Novosphingobium bradum TaxID=1737444 RepID=A0ABV7IQB1_9SPHN